MQTSSSGLENQITTEAISDYDKENSQNSITDLTNDITHPLENNSNLAWQDRELMHQLFQEIIKPCRLVNLTIRNHILEKENSTSTYIQDEEKSVNKDIQGAQEHASEILKKEIKTDSQRLRDDLAGVLPNCWGAPSDLQGILEYMLAEVAEPHIKSQNVIPPIVDNSSLISSTERIKAANPKLETEHYVKKYKRILNTICNGNSNRSKSIQVYDLIIRISIASLFVFIIGSILGIDFFAVGFFAFDSNLLLDQIVLVISSVVAIAYIAPPLTSRLVLKIQHKSTSKYFHRQYKELVQAKDLAQFWFDRWLKQVQEKAEAVVTTAKSQSQERLTAARTQAQQTTAAAQAQAQQELAEFQDRLKPIVDKLHQRFLRLMADTGHISAAWHEAAWQHWRPAAVSASDVRLGTLSVDTSDIAFVFPELDLKFSTPAFLPFTGGRSVLFKATGELKQYAVQAIQNLLFRLLATLPPGKLHLTFIDPLGLGQNVAAFMHLADYDEALVTGKAWSESRHMEQRLTDLTEHMENVIQKYLRNQYQTIEDYNTQAGEVTEAYRLLVVFDFPVNFSDTAARRLVSIAQNGPRCGVYALILADTEKKLPYDFNLKDLEQAATVIAWEGERFVWQDEDFRHCRLELDAPPESELGDRILKAVGEAAKEANKIEVPFERITPAPQQWWMADSRERLRVPLGPTGARKFQYLELGQGTAQHALVAGKTGSGKSTLLHILITNLALTYGPDELELYLIDFKEGVEFKTYATHELPHARVIAIESEREFGLSVLQGLDKKLKDRGDLFRASGVDHIADYRQKTEQPMPRIFLLVDEFQCFFTEDDALASKAVQLLDRIVRQGRAFGIHIMLGSQTLARTSLPRSTVDQMAVRIALQCSEADSRLILAEDNPAARLLSRPGEAIYNTANGLVEGNNLFQVAWLPAEEHDRYLACIHALAKDKNYQAPYPQIVFEGNIPTDVEKNRLLNDLLASSNWPTSARVVPAWLGEPIAICEPVAALFRRQSGSNLLIVSQYDEAARAMMTIALISLAAHAHLSSDPNQNIHFYVLDFSAVDAPDAEFFTMLRDYLPHSLMVGKRRQLPQIIAELTAEVQNRLEAEKTMEPSRYLFIYGFQRARDLRTEDEFSFSSFTEEPAAPNPAQQFITLLREGPEVGIHTLIWCDTLANLNRNLERRALREFTMRIASQMSADDSANLIDTPAASKLGLHRAYFYNEEEGQVEKFRPYALPSPEWLKWAGKQLHDR